MWGRDTEAAGNTGHGCVPRGDEEVVRLEAPGGCPSVCPLQRDSRSQGVMRAGWAWEQGSWPLTGRMRSLTPSLLPGRHVPPSQSLQNQVLAGRVGGQLRCGEK